jgi:hypothetical protein
LRWSRSSSNQFATTCGTITGDKRWGHVAACSGSVEEIASFGPSTDTSNACYTIDVSATPWDTLGYSYFAEVTLTRSSTSVNPQFPHVQLQP